MKPTGVTVRASGDVLIHLRRARDYADRCCAGSGQSRGTCGGRLPIEVRLPATVQSDLQHDAHRVRLDAAARAGPGPAARATNLPVTEVCFAVFCSSLGSFSGRLKSKVGETPSDFQRRYPDSAPHIPAASSSCGAWPSLVLPPQSRRSRSSPAVRSVHTQDDQHLHVSVFVQDVDESKRFYTDVLGVEQAVTRQPNSMLAIPRWRELECHLDRDRRGGPPFCTRVRCAFRVVV
jgi:hypothetical protein